MLLFLIIPQAYGAYTIDRRQYADKFDAPFYNAGRLNRMGKNFCSAVITADNIVITARHCLGGEIPSQLRVIDVYDTTHPITDYVVPDTNVPDDIAHDWAIISVDNAVPISSDITLGEAPENTSVPVTIAGYGSLRVLSDDEIATIRRAYSQYLNDRLKEKGTTPTTSTPTDFLTLFDNNASGTDINFFDGTTRDTFARRSVLEKYNIRATDVFGDGSRMKTSMCKVLFKNGIIYNIKGEKPCQLWSGNSGGPIFFKNDNDTWTLVGIQTHGTGQMSLNPDTFGRFGAGVSVSHFRDAYNRFQTNPPNNDIDLRINK